ncbi:hypothetical protein D3C78_1321820 [compost metagenome]
MIDEAAEHLVAVLAVGASVEDVCVPDLVDLLARHQRYHRVQALEGQEAAVLKLCTVPVCGAHLCFGRCGVLVLEALEVQLADLHFQAVGAQQRLFQGNEGGHGCFSG